MAVVMSLEVMVCGICRWLLRTNAVFMEGFPPFEL